jgi:hypothetical protein
MHVAGTGIRTTGSWRDDTVDTASKQQTDESICEFVQRFVLWNWWWLLVVWQDVLQWGCDGPGRIPLTSHKVVTEAVVMYNRLFQEKFLFVWSVHAICGKTSNLVAWLWLATLWQDIFSWPREVMPLSRDNMNYLWTVHDVYKKHKE